MDNENKTQDYGLRIYNPELGRFLSVDPLEKEFAWNSPYSFAENRVIDGIDLDGSEWERTVTIKKRLFRKNITIISYTIKAKVQNSTSINLTQADINNMMSKAASEMQDMMNAGKKDKNTIYQFKIDANLLDKDEVVTSEDFYFEFNQGEDINSKGTSLTEDQAEMKMGSAAVGETQKGRIPIITCFKQNGELIDMRYGGMMEDILTTIKHELLHTGGLEHVFEVEGGLLDRYNKGELDRNIMSYPGKAKDQNKVPFDLDNNLPFRNDEIIQEQLDTIDKVVIEQQPKKTKK